MNGFDLLREIRAFYVLPSWPRSVATRLASASTCIDLPQLIAAGGTDNRG